MIIGLASPRIATTLNEGLDKIKALPDKGSVRSTKEHERLPFRVCSCAWVRVISWIVLQKLRLRKQESPRLY
jgi:hypothetical protein